MERIRRLLLLILLHLSRGHEDVLLLLLLLGASTKGKQVASNRSDALYCLIEISRLRMCRRLIVLGCNSRRGRCRLGLGGRLLSGFRGKLSNGHFGLFCKLRRIPGKSRDRKLLSKIRDRCTSEVEFVNNRILLIERFNKCIDRRGVS